MRSVRKSEFGVFMRERVPAEGRFVQIFDFTPKMSELRVLILELPPFAVAAPLLPASEQNTVAIYVIMRIGTSNALSMLTNQENNFYGYSKL